MGNHLIIPSPDAEPDTVATLLEQSTGRSADVQSLYFAMHRKAKLRGDERNNIITSVILAGIEQGTAPE